MVVMSDPAPHAGSVGVVLGTERARQVTLFGPDRAPPKGCDPHGDEDEGPADPAGGRARDRSRVAGAGAEEQPDGKGRPESHRWPDPERGRIHDAIVVRRAAAQQGPAAALLAKGAG